MRSRKHNVITIDDDEERKKQSSTRHRFRLSRRSLVGAALCVLLFSYVFGYYIYDFFSYRVLIVTYQMPDNRHGLLAFSIQFINRFFKATLTEEGAARLHLNVNSSCENVMRMGHFGDGGWDVCADKLPKLGASSSDARSCVVYSVGIADDVSFDEHVVATFDCKVFAFDPTIERKTGDDFDVNIHFYKKGLQDPEDGDYISLKHIMNMLGHEHIDLLKMDAESSEWGTFRSWFNMKLLGRNENGKLICPPFSAISMELHFIEGTVGLPVEEFDEKLDYMVELLGKFEDAGFRVFSRLENWRYTPLIMFGSSGVRARQCLEVGMVFDTKEECV